MPAAPTLSLLCQSLTLAQILTFDTSTLLYMFVPLRGTKKRESHLPTAALLRSLQWVSDVCAQHASYPRHDIDLTKLCRISSFPY